MSIKEFKEKAKNYKMISILKYVDLENEETKNIIKNCSDFIDVLMYLGL